MATPHEGPSTAGGGQGDAQEDRKLLKGGEQVQQIDDGLLRLLVGAKQFRRMKNPPKPTVKQMINAACHEMNVRNEGVVPDKSPESIIRKQQKEAKAKRMSERKAAREAA
jgi:hypothetical protein